MRLLILAKIKFIILNSVGAKSRQNNFSGRLRAQLRKRQDWEDEEFPPTRPVVAVAITDERIKIKTGRTLVDLYRFLDRINASQRNRQETSRILSENYKISAWLSESIILRYESEHLLKRGKLL